MIDVMLTCAANRPAFGAPRRCEPEGYRQDLVDEHEVAAWVRATIAELGWVTVDGRYYCQRHNPSDRGAPVEVRHDRYAPLGASGWEARLPDETGVEQMRIEIRMTETPDESNTPELLGDAVRANGRWHEERKHAAEAEAKLDAIAGLEVHGGEFIDAAQLYRILGRPIPPPVDHAANIRNRSPYG